METLQNKPEMKITNIKQQVRDENRVSVYLDGKYSFSLNLTELLDEKLKVGLEINEARLKDLQKRSAEGKLRMRSMEWLMNRPHSEREFRDYLRRKQVDGDYAEYLVSYFKDRKLLNDETYARWLLGVRVGRLKSSRALRAELRSKGVNLTIIDRVISDNPIDELGQIQKIIIKKRRLSRYADDEKLKQYLVRQGYGYSQVAEALNAEGSKQHEEYEESQ